MKHLFIITIIVIFHLSVHAQSPNENFVVEMSPQVKKTEVSDTPTAYPPEEVLSKIQYFDGLGRPTQNIMYKASPSKKDIISFEEYDEYGRVTKKYLPFTSQLFNNNFNLVEQVQDKQSSFYSTVGNISHSEFAFSEIIYDDSPINLVIEKTAPGVVWQKGSGHTIKSEFVINGQNELLKFEVDNNNNLVLSGFWDSEDLMGQIITNEHGKSHVEFKDKSLDRKYVERVENTNGIWHDTYYVYNDLGQLTFVLPPMFISELLGMSNGMESGVDNDIPSGGQSATYEDYHQVFSCSDFLSAFPSGASFNCTGNVIVDISDDVLTIDFDIPSVTGGNYDFGLVAELNTSPAIPNINFGSLPIPSGSAEIYSQDGNLYISRLTRSQLPSVDYTITHNLNTQDNSPNDDYQFESYPTTLPIGSVSSFLLNDWTYQYRYDEKGRVIAKKIPTKEWEVIAYNEQDLPILIQDGELRKNREWLFTKYDVRNRPIATGKVRLDNTTNSMLIGTVMQSLSDLNDEIALYNNSNKHWEERTTNNSVIDGYTDHSYPAAIHSNLYEVLTINYYDDYDFDRNNNPDFTYLQNNEFTNEVTGQVKGLLTGAKIKILETDQWTLRVHFYDKYKRVLQTKYWNAIGEWDVTWNEYDFAGKIKKSVTKRSEQTLISYSQAAIIDKPQEAITEEKRNYTYDHAGRLKKTTLAINGDPTPEVLSVNDYNELGELIKKDIGNTATAPLQTVDYDYNIRGWLTGINRALTSNSNQSPDLFGMELHYNEDHVLSGNAQYNGNISGYTWTSITDGIQRKYGFFYDGLNRLKIADYQSSGIHDFDVSNIKYDRNGNIRTLRRNGLVGNSTFGIMDDLTFYYKKGNQLTRVYDLIPDHSVTNDEFKNGTNPNATTDYYYNLNGAMRSDRNKEINSILYNHLNLPALVSIRNPDGSQDIIEWLYDATGQKVKKKSTLNGIQWYVGGVEYKDGDLEAIYHEEGRITPDGSGWQYEYTLSDHLGNARVSFTDLDNNGKINPNTEILQTQSYYPFGLSHSNPNDVQIGTENLYQLTGKEKQIEITGWSDFGARYYDATIGRWTTSDPLAESMNSWSPYNYNFNNPLKFIDPTGMAPDWIDNGDGTYTAEAGDGAEKLYYQHLKAKGYTKEEVYELLENTPKDNPQGNMGTYKDVDGVVKSAVDEGDVVELDPFAGNDSEAIMQEIVLDAEMFGVENEIESAEQEMSDLQDDMNDLDTEYYDIMNNPTNHGEPYGNEPNDGFGAWRTLKGWAVERKQKKTQKKIDSTERVIDKKNREKDSLKNEKRKREK